MRFGCQRAKKMAADWQQSVESQNRRISPAGTFGSVTVLLYSFIAPMQEKKLLFSAGLERIQKSKRSTGFALSLAAITIPNPKARRFRVDAETHRDCGPNVETFGYCRSSLRFGQTTAAGLTLGRLL